MTMMTSRMAPGATRVAALLWAVLLFGQPVLAKAAPPVTLTNVQRAGRDLVLAAGPDVEGVVLLKQGRWSPEELRAFRDVPWLDAASVRVPWADLEPEDQQFDFSVVEQLLMEVKRYNEAHVGARRTLHLRVMGGVHGPRWFERIGVRFYDTQDAVRGVPGRAIRVPVPYDNPVYLRQLREVYRAMYDRFHVEPLVTVYHGTWSAGPWDEIFHPQGSAALPPGYTPQKFVRGMCEQLDVLIEEFCLRGCVAELPYSGKYPPKDQIDITGPLTARIVERLGKRSPFLYIQSNGWGRTNTGKQTVSWGHERDIQDAFGQVNLSFQALGTNAGKGWLPQGDWVALVELAQRYEAAYVEIYPPDLLPLDARNRIVEAFGFPEPPGLASDGSLPAGFVGFRPWLKRRSRVLYQREGTVTQPFVHEGQPALRGLRSRHRRPKARRSPWWPACVSAPDIGASGTTPTISASYLPPGRLRCGPCFTLTTATYRRACGRFPWSGSSEPRCRAGSLSSE